MTGNPHSWRNVHSFSPDDRARSAAYERTKVLGIPTGSLGRLHDLAIWLAGVRGESEVSLGRCTAVAFCGDHGVAAKGVSSLPQHVTWTNMKYMAEGKAVIAIYAKLLGSRFCVVDIGVNGPHYHPAPSNDGDIVFLDKRVSNGTSDISESSAMSDDEMDAALQVGFDIATLYAPDTDVFVFGEMGIGNTTSCSAIVGALYNEDPDRVTGFGSGISEESRRRKATIVSKAIQRARSTCEVIEPLVCLRELGGLEIAGMAGGMIAAAAKRVPVILDGFISVTAFAIASKIVPGLSGIAVPGTYSPEYGFSIVSKHMELEPILKLGMRLGEGTGAILAWPILQAAAEQLSKGVTKEQLVIDFAKDQARDTS